MSETPRETLERERRKLNDEIRSYPSPIAGCDAQFNFLLERRRELERLIVEAERADETK